MSRQNFTHVGIAGRGRDAIVYRVQDRPGDSVLALKQFSAQDDDATSMQNESKMYGIIWSAGVEHREFSSPIAAFLHILEEDRHPPRPYILFPLLGPNLTDTLRIPGVWPLPRDDIMHMMAQIGHAVEFLHSLAIIHTDLKPGNILLRSAETFQQDVAAGGQRSMRLKSTVVYVIDFTDSVARKGFGYGMIGSPRYRPPEVTMGLRWTSAVDWFALGCIGAELVNGKPLFPFTTTPERRLAAIEKVLGPLPCSMVRRTGQRFERFMQQNPDDSYSVLFPRTTVKDVAEHRTVQDLRELRTVLNDSYFHALCEKYLKIDPRRRCVSFSAS